MDEGCGDRITRGRRVSEGSRNGVRREVNGFQEEEGRETKGTG